MGLVDPGGDGSQSDGAGLIDPAHSDGHAVHGDRCRERSDCRPVRADHLWRGHFVLNGTVEPVGQLFGVNALQISQLTFVPGTSSSDHLLVGATDGVFSGWSDLLINGPAAMAIAISTFGPDTGAGAAGWQPSLAPGPSGPSDPLPGAANGSEIGEGGSKPPASW